MQYRINPKNNDKLSILGYGCMRFSSLTDGSAEIALQEAIDRGVNYFDTAYVYFKGKSEELLGKFLEETKQRDKVFLATKLPWYSCRKTQDFDKYFNIQLNRLRTNRIDYYFIHNLAEFGDWQKLCRMGIVEWIEDNKNRGRIINIGFSFHGQYEEFVKIIDSYDWDMCLIQYNFYDVNNQAGKKGLQYAHKKGVPVMIMEPIRGGNLANNQSNEIKEIWDNAKPKRSIPDWCLRWVWNHIEPLVVLSGMNNVEQLVQNCETADTSFANSLSEDELAVFDKVLAHIRKNMVVPCTGCAYCIPCPKGVNIPMCFSLLNQKHSQKIGTLQLKFQYMMWLNAFSDNQNHARLCVECGACLKKCPQKIDIPKALKQVRKELEFKMFKTVSKIGKVVLKKDKKD